MVVCLSRATPGDLTLMQLGQASGQMGNTNSLKMTWEKKVYDDIISEAEN